METYKEQSVATGSHGPAVGMPLIQMGSAMAQKPKFDIAIEIAEFNDRITILEAAISDNTRILESIRQEIRALPMVRFWRWLKGLFHV